MSPSLNIEPKRVNRFRLKSMARIPSQISRAGSSSINVILTYSSVFLDKLQQHGCLLSAWEEKDSNFNLTVLYWIGGSNHNLVTVIGFVAICSE